jgi:hypothetical protein
MKALPTYPRDSEGPQTRVGYQGYQQPLHARSLVGGLVVTWLAAMLVDGKLDVGFDAAAALLGGTVTWLLSRAYHRGTLLLDHPTSSMSMVIAIYWLVGGLAARATPEVLLSSRASDWLPMSFFEGTFFIIFFAAVSGLPTNRPFARVRGSGLSTRPAMVATGIVWLIRLYLVSQGTYFHGISTVDSYSPGIGFLMQLESSLDFCVPYLIVLLWCTDRQRSALALGGFEVVFLFGTGSRQPFLWFMFMVAVCLSWMGRPLRLRTVVAASAILLLVVHPVMISMRIVAERESGEKADIGPLRALGHILPLAIEDLAQNATSEQVGLSGLARRSTSSGYLAAIMDRSALAGIPLLAGESYLRSAGILVPHFLWADKNPQGIYDPMAESSRHFGLWEADYTFTPLTEAYCNFGTLGVIICGVVFGLLGRFVVGTGRRYSSDPAMLVALMPCFKPIVAFETHGTMGGLSTLRVAFVAMLIIWGVRRWRAPFHRTRSAQEAGVPGLPHSGS